MTRLQMRKTHKLGMAAVLGLKGYNRTHVPIRLHHLIEIRASQLNRRHFCIDMHTRAARKAGESEERIAALAGDVPDGLFDPQERAMLRLTDEVTRLGEHGVSDEAWDDAAALRRRPAGQPAAGHRHHQRVEPTRRRDEARAVTLADVWTPERPRLVGLAYRVLGSWPDAALSCRTSTRRRPSAAAVPPCGTGRRRSSTTW